MAFAADGGGPWYRGMRRCAQHNLSEYDPVTLDVEWWADFWASLHLDSIILTAGGLLAFYPTELQWHRRSQHLGARDLIGEYSAALKARGIRVVARIETNWAHEAVLSARPDWFERDAAGDAVASAETPWLYHTCMFSDYHTTQVPAIMRELSGRYDVDGFFTNSWPPSGRPYRCYCQACRSVPDQSPRALYERTRIRIREVVAQLIAVAGESRPDCVYNINIGGGIRAVQSHLQLGAMGQWLTADHQGRTGEMPIWDVTQQGRVARAIMDDKPLTNVVGTKSGIWRHSTKSKAELEMWLSGCVASGMVPWYVWLGAEVPDRRWMDTGRDFYRWLKRYEAHFANRRSVANVAVLLSQRGNGFYHPPGRLDLGYGARANRQSRSVGAATDHLQGVYLSLLKGRFAFDFVHEEDLGEATLGRYDVLVLPNSALLSDGQCRLIAAYAAAGGSVVAMFETSRYDEWGGLRPDFGLAEVLGIHARGGGGREGRTFYLRAAGAQDSYGRPRGHRAAGRAAAGSGSVAGVPPSHPIVEQFGELSWLPGGEYRVPITAEEGTVLSVVPPYPQGIPEMVYAQQRAELPYDEQAAGEPGVVARERGAGRTVYFTGDVGRCIWLHGNTDLIRMFNAAVHWALHGRAPVTVTGDGMIEYFAWRTAAGYAIHLLNYTNPSMTRADFDSVYALGPQQVRIELEEGAHISRVELLRGGADVPYTQDGSVVRFQVPSVGDYEVAALHEAG